jgi:signal transduction histidine kinase
MPASRSERVVCRLPVQTPPQPEAATYSDLFEYLPHAVIVLGADLRIVLANRAASVLFRVRRERLSGVSISAIVPQRNLDKLLQDLGDRPKVIETCPLPKGVNRQGLTLKIRAVRLPQFVSSATATRGTDASAVNGGFKLLMLENINDSAELEQLLVETEKQAAMAQLAAGILHEVANPLTSLGSNLVFIRSALGQSKAAEVAQALDVSLEQLDQMRQLLGTLSGLPGRLAPRYELADPHELVRRCVTFVAKEAECRKIGLGVSFAASALACEIDVRLIKQVLINLLKNAMEAMPLGGRIDVKTSYHAAAPGEPEAVVIEVADSGIGIPDSDLRKVFRPLFSTKPRGAGLGLSFCRQAVEDHGGAIRLVSRGKDRGTVAIVTLPVRQAATAYE